MKSGPCKFFSRLHSFSGSLASFWEQVRCANDNNINHKFWLVQKPATFYDDTAKMKYVHIDLSILHALMPKIKEILMNWFFWSFAMGVN